MLSVAFQCYVNFPFDNIRQGRGLQLPYPYVKKLLFVSVWPDPLPTQFLPSSSCTGGVREKQISIDLLNPTAGVRDLCHVLQCSPSRLRMLYCGVIPCAEATVDLHSLQSPVPQPFPDLQKNLPLWEARDWNCIQYSQR